MEAWHEEIVDEFAAAVNRQDLSDLEPWVHPDLVYDFSRSIGVDAGTYRGIAAMQEFLDNFADAWEEVSWDVTRVEELGADRLLISTRLSARGRGSGLEVNARVAQLLEFRDRKLIRMTMFQGRDEAATELGL